MFDELRNFSLFKTEEEKRKEYEDNIAKNVAAMEIANLPPERETFVGEPSPLFNTTDTVYFSDLGGKYYTDPGPFTRPGVLFSSLSPEEQKKALGDTQQVAESVNRMSRILPGLEKGTIINPTLLQPDARQAYLKEAGKVFSATQQDKLALAEKAMMEQMSANQLTPSEDVSNYLATLGGGDTKAIAAATKKAQIDPATLLTLLSAFTSNNQVKPPMPSKQATATRGLIFDDEDPYERYKRQGGIL